MEMKSQTAAPSERSMPPAAEASETPARRRRREQPYGSSLLGMACRIENFNGPKGEAAKQTLEELLAEYLDRGSSSLVAACWSVVAKDAGIALSHDELKQQATQITPLVKALQADGWLAQFLHGLAYGYELDPALTPEDVLWNLSNDYDQFTMAVQNAQTILRNHAEIVADDIERVITERPELLKKGTADTR